MALEGIRPGTYLRLVISGAQACAQGFRGFGRDLDWTGPLPDKHVVVHMWLRLFRRCCPSYLRAAVWRHVTGCLGEAVDGWLGCRSGQVQLPQAHHSGDPAAG